MAFLVVNGKMVSAQCEHELVLASGTIALLTFGGRRAGLSLISLNDMTGTYRRCKHKDEVALELVLYRSGRTILLAGLAVVCVAKPGYSCLLT
ncbi:hypothetical protein CLV58_1418 [Spirosoma oryzae]|uniref:Uncharacterized protein n=1 Tax=Spirosoma oryzae TaxID=1469603 RepID=A0A2T0RQT6_9BACT|nr:hypothetical protein CLV58_1418 [Spirosoma oryzae]